MSDVSRAGFDRLAERVARIERTLAATVNLAAAEVVGLRSGVGEGFADVQRHLSDVRTHIDGTRGALSELATAVDHGFVTLNDKLDQIVGRR